MKENVNLVCMLMMSALSGINIIVCVCGYIFTPADDLIILIVCIFILAVAAALSLRWRQFASDKSRTAGVFMPLAAVLYIISSALALDMEVS